MQIVFLTLLHSPAAPVSGFLSRHQCPRILDTSTLHSYIHPTALPVAYKVGAARPPLYSVKTANTAEKEWPHPRSVSGDIACNEWVLFHLWLLSRHRIKFWLK